MAWEQQAKKLKRDKPEVHAEIERRLLNRDKGLHIARELGVNRLLVVAIKTALKREIGERQQDALRKIKKLEPHKGVKGQMPPVLKSLTGTGAPIINRAGHVETKVTVPLTPAQEVAALEDFKEVEDAAADKRTKIDPADRHAKKLLKAIRAGMDVQAQAAMILKFLNSADEKVKLAGLKLVDNLEESLRKKGEDEDRFPGPLFVYPKVAAKCQHCGGDITVTSMVSVAPVAGIELPAVLVEKDEGITPDAEKLQADVMPIEEDGKLFD